MRTEPNHWNHRTATFAAALAGSLLLAGCGGLSVPGFGGGSDAEEAPAPQAMMLVPGETVCLMPNAQLASEELDNVLLLGMRAGGVDARLTRRGEPAGACPKTISYGLTVVDKKIKSIDFRLETMDRPLAQASGPADEKGEIPMKRVHAYVATFVARLFKTPMTQPQTKAE